MSEREHKEGCCSTVPSVAVTVADELECDAECWCHTVVEHSVPDDEDVTAPKPSCNCRERRGLWEEGKTAPACPIHGTELLPGLNIPEEPQGPNDDLVHHGCCGCDGCHGGFAGRQDEPTYDPRAAGTVYPANHNQVREQEYVRKLVDPISATRIDMCKGCGVLVGDKDQHDVWHSKTRSIV